MNIVLEGPDASGKSTLAEHIKSFIHWPIQPSEGPEKYPGEINERIERYLKFNNTIFDRHPVISQSIYGQFNDTTGVDPILANEFYGTEPLLIYCARDSESFPKNHKKKGHDTDRHVSLIENHDGEIVQLYEDWAMQHAHFIYRIGDPTWVIDKYMSTMLLPDLVWDIACFHKKFGLEYDGRARALPPNMQEFRSKFLNEELEEYELAVNGSDLEGALDALVDLVYVALGTAHLHGFDFREAWRRVHEANMKKVRVERVDQSSRGSLFDVVKPPGWRTPSLSDLVRE